jgi:octaprenyl-diphosphate synthase
VGCRPHQNTLHNGVLPSPSSPVTAAPPDRLAALLALTKEDRERVDALLNQHLQSKVPLIPLLSGHLVQAGGKRIRPTLLLAASRLCGYEGNHHIALAASVECIHTATLLHDDVVDESQRRRGQDTANHVWGNKASVLVGDYLFSRAFTLMVEAGRVDILAVLAAASNTIAEGEVLQLAIQGQWDQAEKHYFDVIHGKTAVLFAAACQIGAMLANVPPAQVEALRAYGLNVGMAFQIADDALDYSGQSGLFGKAIGNDLAQHKITLPVLFSYRHSNAKEKAFWHTLMTSQTAPSAAELEKAKNLLCQHDAIANTLQTAREYAAKALSSLASFSVTPMQVAMADLTHFVTERNA